MNIDKESDKEYYIYQNFFWKRIIAIEVDWKKSFDSLLYEEPMIFQGTF